MLSGIWRAVLATALVSGAAAPATAQSWMTAEEVRPILNQIKGSWVSVRRYDGQDLLYFTNMLIYRCGLNRIAYSINGGPVQEYVPEPCHEGTATPFALTGEGGHLPYLAFPEGSIETVMVQLLYDDGGKDAVVFERAQVESP